MRLRTSAIALAIAGALPSVAAAVDFSYSGFSTAAYAQTDTDEAQVGYSGQPDGIDSDGSFEIDSKLGLQVTAKFNEMFSAVVQGVAYADLSGDWEPRLDWAYVRFRPLSSVSVRAGYLRTPTFMYSDSVFIGYANTWIRPPMEVYNMSAVYRMRGVDVTWRGRVGPLTVSVNPYYGDSEVDLESETLDVPEWIGIAATVEYNSFLARAGYSEVELGSTTTGRSIAQVKATWARITFTGKGTPPKELKSEAEVKAFVAGDPKAIGYIDSSALDGSVKAVLTL